MQADLPHTLYKSGGGDAGGQKTPEFKFNPNDPAIQKQLEANKRAALRRAKERGEYTVEQVFQ